MMKKVDNLFLARGVFVRIFIPSQLFIYEFQINDILFRDK